MEVMNTNQQQQQQITLENPVSFVYHSAVLLNLADLTKSCVLCSMKYTLL